MRKRDGWIDLPRWERALGVERARALNDWAEELRIHLHLIAQLTNGKTGAPVVVAQEQPRGGRSRPLVLKVSRSGETGPHEDAVRLNPDFAEKHLVRFAREPVSIGGGEWVLFQEVAGASLTDMRPVAVLLDPRLPP